MIDPKLVTALNKSLPFLPGHHYRLSKNSPNERKSHAFDYCNNVPVFKTQAPGIGGAPLPGQEKDNVRTSMEVYPRSENNSELLPAWAVFDRQVLRFYAFFQEQVQERREEKYRIRRVNIYFYLEDDSVHVSEPRTVNSGIPQGTLIRRHRIPRSVGDKQHLIVTDFNVGKSIALYARTMKIVGCDSFTRDFLSKLNIVVPANTEFPPDPYEQVRLKMLSNMKPTRPSFIDRSLKQFLENDRRVLRFYCVWDDRTSIFGDLRHMVIQYYLSDDTIEIIESIPANSGRSPNPLFLRRCKLPKRVDPDGWSNNDGNNAYYTDADLMIGSVLHLYGRPFLICDCDEFTKSYYSENYNVQDFDPVSVEEFFENDSDLPFFDASAHQEPPQSGLKIGYESQEKKDFKKLMKYDGVSLRFLAKLISNKQIDRDRKFVISLHLADDTISIFEPRARNSGVLGGKFLESRKIKKGTDGYYGPQDFYIGAEITSFEHHFKLVDADDYAVKFMLANPSMFPRAGGNNANEENK